jgi:hypothetical protein|tara:strand:+ start:282 stop:1184 length:903 start_codon:yes stop_codon:yes gene_type:complete
MKNYLYFAEATVESGDDRSSEALCVPASSYIGADPGDGTTTLRFKNAMGDLGSGEHKVVISHTAGKNKEVMDAIISIMNNKSEGGFVVVADFETGTAVSKSSVINKELLGLGLSSVAITETPVGGITGRQNTALAASHGAGAVSTESSPQYYKARQGRDIITTVAVDLTGLANKNDVGDVIGLDTGGSAYIFKYVPAETGIIYKIEMTCLELPTASSNVGLDIDLFSSSNATRAYDYDISSATQVIDAGGDMVLGDTLQNLADHGAANDYYYLVTGNTHTGDSTYTAGKLMIKFYGHPQI